MAYLGSGDKYQDVALLFRSIIMRAFRESDELDWPPAADEFGGVPSAKAHPVPQFSHNWKGRREIESCILHRTEPMSGSVRSRMEVT